MRSRVAATPREIEFPVEAASSPSTASASETSDVDKGEIIFEDGGTRRRGLRLAEIARVGEGKWGVEMKL
jgi:hypothetical protein